MSPIWLTPAVVLPTALVVAALFAVLWRARSSPRDAEVAVAAGITLVTWAVLMTVLARSGRLQPAPDARVPPVGVILAAASLFLALCLATSASLRRMLSRQQSLILLNVWRLEGVVFLVLMVQGLVPALWAIPAGCGDVLVALAAPWVARHLDTPEGRRRAVIFNYLGLLDLVVAIGLGVTTTPGPTQLFHTTTTANLLVQFPLALVPTFLVPLAIAVHVVSLLKLREIK